mgnify:CR=1 FL=1
MLFLCFVLAPHHSQQSGDAQSLFDPDPARVIFSEFYPCGLQDDEYFVLTNIGGSSADLFNWSVTDLEGALRFVSHELLPSGGRLTVSANSSSYLRAYGRLPDVQMDDEGCQLISRTGTFRLADVGDSITLVAPSGSVADFVRYGLCDENGSGWMGPSVPALKKGEIARRIAGEGSLKDTDSAGDWTPFREHRYGYTDLGPRSESVGAGELTAFVSPDCGLPVVVSAIDQAHSDIRLCAYEFSSSAVCKALVEALWRGVSVRVLVDGAPAGGMTDEQLACLSFLQDSGAAVLILLGNVSEGIVQHVGPLHAKYLVVDSSLGVVLSENFVESGLPNDPFEGNRGWGVAFRDEGLAEYLEDLFDEDSRAGRQDVRCWRDDPRYVQGLQVDEGQEWLPRVGIIGPHKAAEACMVTIVPSPDCSAAEPFLLPMIAGAQEVAVEQFQADLMWRDRWTGNESLSPLVGAVEEALGEGASASILLDPSWFNTEDNSAVAEHIVGFATSRGLSGEAKLMDCSGPAKTLHNKGLVLNGTTSIVSSNNWGVSSFARNRELAVMVESAEVAEYFGAAFRMDWEPDAEPPRIAVSPEASAMVGEVVLLNGSQSSDDRGIAQWIWSFDGPGLLVPEGPSAWFYATRPGTFQVRLSIRDAWGNMDSEVVTIRVSSRDDVGTASAALPWAAAVASACGGTGLGVWAARKVNHRRRGSG